MVMGVEVVTIESCPLCHQAHRYGLPVQRAMMFKHMGSRPQHQQIGVTRLFTCPVTNEEFQARVSIWSSGDIEGIGDVPRLMPDD